MAVSVGVIFKYCDIDAAFAIKFFKDSRTNLTEPVDPEVANNKPKSG